MIRNMVTWLEHIGMVTVDGQFMAVKDGTAAPAPDTAAAVTPDGPEKPAETGAGVSKPTEQAGDRSPAPVISLSFEVKITMDDLARLSPD